jgi:hypothetical protein
VGGIALQLHRPHSLLHSIPWTRKEVRCNAIPPRFSLPFAASKRRTTSTNPLSPLFCSSIRVVLIVALLVCLLSGKERGTPRMFIVDVVSRLVGCRARSSCGAIVRLGWSNRSSWVMELSTSWVVEHWSGKVGSWNKRGATTHAWRARILTHGHNYSDYMPFFLFSTPLVN